MIFINYERQYYYSKIAFIVNQIFKSQNFSNKMEFEQLQVQTYSNQNQEQGFTISLKQIIEANPEDLLKLMIEKDQMIQSFSRQITKYKASELKSKKLISSLQEKVQKYLPSSTDTSNNFMIPSQFKNMLTNFMTNTVPSVFYNFVDYPKVYQKLVQRIMNLAYEKTNFILKNKLNSVRKCLIDRQEKPGNNLVPNLFNTEIEQLKYHLLNFFQRNFRQIFKLKHFQKQGNQNQQFQTSLSSAKWFEIKIFPKQSQNDQIQEKINELNSGQIQSSEQLSQFCQELYQICVYMILQQNPWEFVFIDENQNDQNVFFSKKQFTCIDGFLKQGEQAIYILKGLKRKDKFIKQYILHPNIKNFVIPCLVMDSEEQVNFEIEVGIFIFDQKTSPNSKFANLIDTQIKDNDVEKNIKIYDLPVLKESKFNSQNLPLQQLENNSCFQIQQKQIYINPEKFKIKEIQKTQKSQIISSMLINQQKPEIIHQNIPKLQNIQIEDFNCRQHDKQNFNINIEQTINKKNSQLKKEKWLLDKNLLKKGKKQKNGSTVDLTNQKRKLSQKQCSQNTQHLNKRKNEQLPLYRDIPKSSKKKVGKSSRKCSVGKIISQSTQINNSKTHGRDKISISHHSTLVIKQTNKINQLHPQNIFESQIVALQNNENIGNFVGHLYEKNICRPKKSLNAGGKIQKHDEKALISSVVTAKEQRPLALRMYQNNCLVGKIRDKYLAN